MSEDRVSVFWVIHADKPLTLSVERPIRERVEGGKGECRFGPGTSGTDHRGVGGPYNNFEGDERHPPFPSFVCRRPSRVH